jgi:hypothetical protein
MARYLMGWASFTSGQYSGPKLNMCRLSPLIPWVTRTTRAVIEKPVLPQKPITNGQAVIEKLVLPQKQITNGMIGYW